MMHTARVDTAQNARNEITMRLKQIDVISNKFRNSFSGYTENTETQKVTAFFFGLAAFVLLIFPPFIIESIFSTYGGHLGQMYYVTAFIALYSACIYFALLTYKYTYRLGRIARIDNHIRSVNAIKTALTTYLGSIDKTTDDLAQEIQQKNMKIMPVSNIDAEISRYQTIAGTYTEAEGHLLNRSLLLLHFISSLFFGITLVAINGEAVTLGICLKFDIDIYEVVLVTYVLIALACFIAVNVYYIRLKNEDYNGLGYYILSLASGLVAIPLAWALWGIIYLIILSIAFIVSLFIVVMACAIIFGR